MSSARALWIYSLLARLEKPLYSETAALIRSLLRRCCELRVLLANRILDQYRGDVETLDISNIDGVNYNTELASLNIIITITGSYFGQAEESFGCSEVETETKDNENSSDNFSEGELDICNFIDEND